MKSQSSEVGHKINQTASLYIYYQKQFMMSSFPKFRLEREKHLSDNPERLLSLFFDRAGNSDELQGLLQTND